MRILAELGIGWLTVVIVLAIFWAIILGKWGNH